VEIMGQEFSFYGGEQGAGGGGIIATVPRTVPPPAKYRYLRPHSLLHLCGLYADVGRTIYRHRQLDRESIEMGQIRLSSSELRAVINNLAKEFTSASLGNTVSGTSRPTTHNLVVVRCVRWCVRCVRCVA
jgi:hypothetical protein